MRMPPLTALRAFESAGRKKSFTRAAECLNVSTGAISRQIRVLEDFLGKQLFVRANREVTLTPAGCEYLEQLTEAFGLIGRATDRIMSVPENAPFRLSTSPTFTQKWLMPRLVSYNSLCSHHDLQLTMCVTGVDFRHDNLDAAIQLGGEDAMRSRSFNLFRTDLVAVCSPKLLKGSIPLNRVEDLHKHTLLHSSARMKNWERWLSEAGHPDIKGAHTLVFESSSLAYQAAVAGLGIAIGQLPLLVDDLKSGSLVIPFPITVPDSSRWNLVVPDRTPHNRTLKRFLDWVLREAKATAADVDEMLGNLEEFGASTKLPKIGTMKRPDRRVSQDLTATC
jgi:LysR family transcriptional regulator, glycine cleavage system transcriptional activator